MTASAPRPLVLLPACTRMFGNWPFHTVGDKYLRALAEASGVQPLILPNLADLVDPLPLLDQVDGLLMTGSPSNVHPSHYGREDLEPVAKPFDPARDAISLAMIRGAVERGVPLFCICRGFQEMNVALGGSLHPRLHVLEDRRDHRSLATGERDIDYGPRHALTLAGWFAELFGQEAIMINSLHHQGIDSLAPGLVAEGWAPDGTIEAVRAPGAKALAIGVQWHPEYGVMDNPQSLALFRAFGAAVAEHQGRRLALAA